MAYVSRFPERPVTVGLISRSGRRNRIGEDDELDHQDESRGDGAEEESAKGGRIETLAKQLIERLRPFVNAKHPGDKNDPDVLAFEKKMKKEAENMKLESFGVEVFSSSRAFPIKRLRIFARSSCTRLDRCTGRRLPRFSSHTQRGPAARESNRLTEWSASLSIFSSSRFFSVVMDVFDVIDGGYVLFGSPRY